MDGHTNVFPLGRSLEKKYLAIEEVGLEHLKAFVGPD